MTFKGFGINLGYLPCLSDAETRSISADNVHGEKGGSAQAEITDCIS